MFHGSYSFFVVVVAGRSRPQIWMRIDVECNNVYIFAGDKDRTRGKLYWQIDRQKKQANKTSKQTITSTSKGTRARRVGGRGGGMLTTSRREGNIHQLVLVVLVARGGNFISMGLFIYLFSLNCRRWVWEERKKAGQRNTNQDLTIWRRETLRVWRKVRHLPPPPPPN